MFRGLSHPSMTWADPGPSRGVGSPHTPSLAHDEWLELLWAESAGTPSQDQPHTTATQAHAHVCTYTHTEGHALVLTAQLW